MILFWRETQDGSFSAQDLRPAGAAAGVHAAAPLHAGAGPGGVRLANEVRAAMPDPEQFVPDTLENITAYVRNDLCIGAWQGSRLGGYLIVRFCGRSAHNYAAFMDVPRTEWEHWANADSAIVHADFRGNGLQRLMLEAALPLFPKKSPTSVLPSARRTSTACTTPLRPVLPSSPGGKCTAATTVTCWQRSCKKL